MRGMQGILSYDISRARDELAEYLREDTAALNTNPIDYWLSATIQSQWPRLLRMAIDVYTIPPMSSEPERIFSLAGVLITQRRNRLKDDVIEAHECLSSWNRSGLIRIGAKGELEQLNDEDPEDPLEQLFQAYKG
jgi:hypothetical protein